ncbi:MAG TPA: GNAT family protein [Gaiellales bacterium]|nr:GNAT family protein [Gaiellales bacterium]
MACAAEGKGVDADSALAWIEVQLERQAEAAGLSLAIADASSGEALGCISLNARARPGMAPIGGPADGRLAFDVQAGTAGIGYWVLPRARRRGLATTAVRLLTRWAMAEAGLRRVEALVEPANRPSLRVLERSSFRREGLLRDYLDLGDGNRRDDAYVYSLIPGDLPAG